MSGVIARGWLIAGMFSVLPERDGEPLLPTTLVRPGCWGVSVGLTQFVQFSIGTVDVVTIGQLGPDPLAGASLGLVILYVVFLFGFGPASSLSNLIGFL